jgi:tetratricopeptide (TPR) repeat protein
MFASKTAEKINHLNAQEMLQTTAIYVPDRCLLKAKIEKIRNTEFENKPLKAKKQDIISEIDSYKEPNISNNPTKQELIERFLKINNPKIKNEEKSEKDDINIDKIVRKSANDEFKIVTETMAKVYLKQGNKVKAIKIYQQLIANNPEKSIYFANQIKKIEED